MKKSVKSIQIVLGLIFLLAGLNGWVVFFGFSPFLPTSPEAMAFFWYPYLLFTEKTVEVAGGLLLLTNRWVPLALNVLAPIVLNILLFHLFVDFSLLPLALSSWKAYFCGHIEIIFRVFSNRRTKKSKMRKIRLNTHWIPNDKVGLLGKAVYHD